MSQERRARASDAGSPDEIRARFKADEINRALRARSDKTNFDSTKNTVAGSGNAYAPAASFTGNRTNAQRISDINAEQNGLQERIQMMESKVRADEAALPGRLEEARIRGEQQFAEARQGGAGSNATSVTKGVPRAYRLVLWDIQPVILTGQVLME